MFNPTNLHRRLDLGTALQTEPTVQPEHGSKMKRKIMQTASPDDHKFVFFFRSNITVLKIEK